MAPLSQNLKFGLVSLFSLVIFETINKINFYVLKRRMKLFIYCYVIYVSEFKETRLISKFFYHEKNAPPRPGFHATFSPVCTQDYTRFING